MIGEVLQRIYDSEINLHLAWMWDGGLEYTLEHVVYPFECKYDLKQVHDTGEDRFDVAFGYLVEDILKQYPNSTFSKWFNNQLVSTNLFAE